MTLRERQLLAERHAYELRLPDKPLQRNPLNGRFLKGHTPANKGKKWSEFMSKRGQRKAKKGWKNLVLYRADRSPEAGRKKKAVIAVNDTGKFLFFPSVSEAGSLLGISHDNISRCCRDNQARKQGRNGNVNTNHKYKGIRFYFENDPVWTEKINQQ